MRNVITQRRYGYWRELLEQWVFLVERIHRVTVEKHSVYSYKERTNVGLLAAAATANGWIALEECRSEKYSSKDSEEVYQGRSDLRIWRDKRHHEIEAKFLRIALTSTSTTRLTKAAEKSVADAARSVESGDRFDRKIAVTFVVPTLTNSQADKLSEKMQSEHQERLINFIQEKKPSFMAYAFPGRAPVAGSLNRQALGVILFGTEPSEA
ncbi:hypothetical protein [Aromatoleum bremense]|uniref:Anti-bacteriophage protein A/HamA C-terminal domain-containing protein n=1 Tax=Aromatoleum bremense TaxID=76115 RepID=A0ABX1P043_9RHOO|nr:hypothetical protein [Aromatoleum bremense]NMG17468.1 hypothetical protein [Aromatoleum bremense]QTQ30849.1 Uncharacterized protein pbN1_08570 [Aromatoleum bremense]